MDEPFLLACPPNTSLPKEGSLRTFLEPARARLGPARERIFTYADERPTVFLGWVWVVTFVAAFLVNALGAALLLWRGDPLVTTYRTTLDFTSALLGDAILIPIANVLMVAQLLEWRRAVRLREVLVPLVAGGAVTLALHLFQGTNDLVNWTMPRPFAWTFLGYTHALYMWAQLSFIGFFWTQAGLIARLAPRAALRPRLGFVLLCMAVFLRLLLGDYGYLR